MSSSNERQKNVKSTILIVDDNVTMVSAVQRLLLFEDKYEIKIRYDGDNISGVIAELKPDLIILDMRMSRFNGFEICSNIRRDPKNNGIKILAFSGTFDENEIKTMLKIGADDYLEKPFKNSDLLGKVEKLLDQGDQKLVQAPEEKDVGKKLSKAQKDLKKAQNKLIQADKLAAIGQLVAGIAHEIKNPVGFISSNLQTLESYVSHYIAFFKLADKTTKFIADGQMAKAQAMAKKMALLKEEKNLNFIIDDTNNLVQECQDGVERIKKIITDLRTFARTDSEVVNGINIEEIVDSILSIVWNEIKYKVELKKEYAHVPLIKGSPQKLGQVFINLLVNASQAIEQRGMIEIKTYVEKNFVCVSIKDTGQGIDENDLKNIFDSFFTTKSVEHGTGLGLSISYEIIKEHEGDIKVASELGKGTTFIVMLPM